MYLNLCTLRSPNSFSSYLFLNAIEKCWNLLICLRNAIIKCTILISLFKALQKLMSSGLLTKVLSSRKLKRARMCYWTNSSLSSTSRPCIATRRRYPFNNRNIALLLVTPNPAVGPLVQSWTTSFLLWPDWRSQSVFDWSIQNQTHITTHSKTSMGNDDVTYQTYCSLVSSLLGGRALPLPVSLVENESVNRGTFFSKHCRHLWFGDVHFQHLHATSHFPLLSFGIVCMTSSLDKPFYSC